MERLRGMTWAQRWSLFVPRRVDELLYVAPRTAMDVPHTVPRPLSINRYSHDNIPSRLQWLQLTPRSLLYVVTDAETGGVIHWTAVVFDGLLPARFGYDPAIPLIGDVYTDVTYRGHHLKPHVLSYILQDLREADLASTAYALVSPTNTSGIHGLERAGFTPVARLMAWEIGGLLLRKKRVPCRQS